MTKNHQNPTHPEPVAVGRGMRPQPRDSNLCFTIQDQGGLLALRQIQTQFWPLASQRALFHRLSLLVEHEYLDRPSREEWRSQPICEPVYWLGWRGILWVAEQQGVHIDPPRNSGENQLRALQQTLKKQGIHWLREPAWSTLAHEIALIDFRLALELAVGEFPFLSIDKMVLDREFRRKMDLVRYQYRSAGGRVIQGERGVCPDLFVILADEERKQKGESHKMPLLVEMDMGTHPVASRFGQEKAASYASYPKSAAYRARFGLSTGVWLVVTTGERRMHHLMQQTEDVVGLDANSFFFTLRQDLEQGNILSTPIWRQTVRRNPTALLKA